MPRDESRAEKREEEGERVSEKEKERDPSFCFVYAITFFSLPFLFHIPPTILKDLDTKVNKSACKASCFIISALLAHKHVIKTYI